MTPRETLKRCIPFAQTLKRFPQINKCDFFQLKWLITGSNYSNCSLREKQSKVTLQDSGKPRWCHTKTVQTFQTIQHERLFAFSWEKIYIISGTIISRSSDAATAIWRTPRKIWKKRSQSMPFLFSRAVQEFNHLILWQGLAKQKEKDLTD